MIADGDGPRAERGLEVVNLAALADLVADRVVSRLLSARGSGQAVIGVPERQDDERDAVPLLLTAAEIASRFGVSAEWVRDNAERLEAVCLGDGPRPRLRFDAGRVLEALTRRSGSGRSDDENPPVETVDREARREGDLGSRLDNLPFRELEPRRLPRNRPGAAGTARGTATRTMASPRQQPNPPRGGSAAARRSSPPRPTREEPA